MSIKLLLAALSAALALISASMVHARQGDPIPGRDIVLEGDPNAAVAATAKTDAKGNARFMELKPGRYAIATPDISQFKGPVVIAVSVNGGPAINSEPLKASKGKAYALDKSGRKLIFTVDKVGTPIIVTIFDRWGN